MGISLLIITLLLGSSIVAVRTSQIYRDFILVGRVGTPVIFGELKRLGIIFIGTQFSLFLILGVKNIFEFSIFMAAITLQMYLLLHLNLRLKSQRFELFDFVLFLGKVFLGLFLVYTVYQATLGASLKTYSLLGIRVAPVFKALTAILFLAVFMELILPLYIRLFLNPKSIPSADVGNFLNACFKTVELKPIETRIVDFGGIRYLDILVVGFKGAPSFLRPIILVNKELFSTLKAEEFQALLLQKVSRYDQSLYVKRTAFFFLSIPAAGFLAKWSNTLILLFSTKYFAPMAMSFSVAIGILALTLTLARWLRLQQLQSDVLSILGYGVTPEKLISGIHKIDTLRGKAFGTFFSPEIPTDERGELIYERIYRHQSGRKAFSSVDYLSNLGGGKLGTSTIALVFLLFSAAGVSSNYFKKELKSFSQSSFKSVPQKRMAATKIVKSGKRSKVYR